MLHPRFPFSAIPFCRYVWIHQLLLAPSTCQVFIAILFAFFFSLLSCIPAVGVRGLWAFLFLFPTVTVEDLLEFSQDVEGMGCMGFVVTGSTVVGTNISQQKDLDLQSAESFVRMRQTYDLLLFILH